MDNEDIQEEASGGSSRLDREAKIGVTVILLLLMVFGVVAAWRLAGGSSEDDTVASATDANGNQEPSIAQSKSDSLVQDATQDAAKPRLLGDSPRATVVPAEPALTAPPPPADDVVDPWKLASDKADAKPGDSSLPSSPPPLVLEPSPPDLDTKPSRDQTHASTVSSQPQHRNGRTYTVAKGDTLFNIARYELGKASRWGEIYELNRDVLGKDFNDLVPGTQLTLPESEKSNSLTRRPGNAY